MAQTCVVFMDDAGDGARGLKPHVTARLAEAVRQLWGVDIAHAELLDGSTGLNLRVGGDLGPVVVRVHRAHVSAQRVEALQVAREVAGATGVPIAGPVLGCDSRRQVTVDGCVVEVERFVTSNAKMDSLDRIVAAMPTLARLHEALAAADIPDAAAELRFGNYISSEELVDRVAAGAARIRSVAPTLSELADAAEALAVRLQRACIAGPSFESQWCHGDFWDDNVLFRGRELALVTDFGFMNRRPRIDDLALTLYFTLWELNAVDHPDPARELSRLIDTYDNGANDPLREVERGAIPAAIVRVSRFGQSASGRPNFMSRLQ